MFFSTGSGQCLIDPKWPCSSFHGAFCEGTVFCVLCLGADL